MKKTSRFIINGLVMCITGVAVRAVGVAFNVYASNKIGAEGMGIFSLVMSVYTFALTLAVSGIGLAVTRCVSEALAAGCPENVRPVMQKSLVYALFFSLLSSFLLFAISRPVGTNILRDVRTVSSLRLLALSLPAISVSSVLNGYFLAVR